MIARTPRERELYEARLKMERDTAAQLEYATAKGVEQGIELGVEQGIELGIERGIELGIERGLVKGLEEGRVQGEFVGRIRLLEQLLGLPESSSDALEELNIEQLSQLEQRLQAQLRERR